MLYNSATIQSRWPPFGKAFLDYTYARHSLGFGSVNVVLLPQPPEISWKLWFLFSYCFPSLLNKGIEYTVLYVQVSQQQFHRSVGYICNRTKVTSQLCASGHARGQPPAWWSTLRLSPSIEALYYIWPKVKRVQIISIIDRRRSVGGSEYGWQAYPDEQFGRISGSGWKW